MIAITEFLLIYYVRYMYSETYRVLINKLQRDICLCSLSNDNAMHCNANDCLKQEGNQVRRAVSLYILAVK